MPAAIPIAAAAVGVIGSAVAGASGVGKNGMRASNFADSNKYNPNAFNYGGAPGGAQQATQRYEGLAQQATQRSQPFSVQGNANYTGANSWEAAQLGGRNGQDQAAMMMHRRAMGLEPSIAGQQAANDIGLLQQGTANQMRMAQQQQAAQQASARGAAGVALAQQGAANNMANTGQALGLAQTQGIQNISNQAQINAANERMQAEQAAFGAWSGMRSGDQAAQGMSTQQAQFDANLGQQNNQFNAGMMLQNRAQNDQTGLAYNQLANSVNNQQLQAGIAQQGLLAQTHGSTDALNMQKNQANANREMDFFKSGLGAVSSAASMGAGMAAPTPKAKGGPISAGRPYLVGERGPEIIVPREAGLVIPNHDIPFTSMARGASVVRDEGEIDAGAPAPWLEQYAQEEGLLSDDRAKLIAAKDAGRNEVLGELERELTLTPEDLKNNPQTRGAVLMRQARGLGRDEGRFSAMPPAPARPAPREMQSFARDRSTPHPDAAEGRERAASAAYEEAMSGQPGRTSTAQLARGLAPISYEYKPGMGPPGPKTGVRAQAMEREPLTASAIRRRPDGMRVIDRDQGLSTALAGVGLLADKVARLERGKR